MLIMAPRGANTADPRGVKNEAVADSRGARPVALKGKGKIEIYRCDGVEAERELHARRRWGVG
jgi:hypothetical protein